MPEIKITCKGSRNVPISELQTFQGNLKELDKKEFEKLKRSFIKQGFTFPMFVWGNKILDGHQRLFVLKEMLKDGYTIKDIPVAEVHNEDDAMAAEKLLRLNSSHGKMTDEGLYEFINQYTVDISEFAGDLNLPDIDMDKFLKGYVDDGEAGEGEGGERQEINEIYAVYIECGNEVEQLDLLSRFEKEGLKCRALIS